MERKFQRKDTRQNKVRTISIFRKIEFTSWLQLYADREMITFANRAEGDNGEAEVDPVWDFLYKVTSFLHSEGMSSDESDQEGSGPPYYIRIREWRSRELIPYLQMIDRDRKRVNGYRNNRPGKAPRERIRVVAGSMSTRKVIPELPLNFYDKTWYAGLSKRDRTLLRARPALDLPVIVAYN